MIDKRYSRRASVCLLSRHSKDNKMIVGNSKTHLHFTRKTDRRKKKIDVIVDHIYQICMLYCLVSWLKTFSIFPAWSLSQWYHLRKLLLSLLIFIKHFRHHPLICCSCFLEYERYHYFTIYFLLVRKVIFLVHYWDAYIV